MTDGGPQSNLGVLLNNLGVTDATAVDTIGSAIGSVADVAGAVEAAVAIADLFIKQPDPLQPILDALQKDFAQLYAVLEARFNEQDWVNLATLVKDAEAVLLTLDGLVHANPPLTDVQRLDHIATCIAPLNALSDQTVHFPSPFFLADYPLQVYWTDAGVFLQPVYTQDDLGNWVQVSALDTGYGVQPPPAPSDNQVFSYLYVLPYYLKAVFILTVVGASFFADFGKTSQRQQDAIILFSNFLTTIHNLIAGGITKLTPAPPPQGWAFGVANGVVPGITGEFQPPPQLTGMAFEWGAVERFSGASSIRSGGFTFSATPNPDGPIFQKLQVRAQREMIKVYANVGLPLVWIAINGLNKMAGQPPLAPHKYSGWSLRETFAQAGVGARGDGLFHLSDMANLLWRTPPYDVSQTIFPSWRTLLEPA